MVCERDDGADALMFPFEHEAVFCYEVQLPVVYADAIQRPFVLHLAFESHLSAGAGVGEETDHGSSLPVFCGMVVDAVQDVELGACRHFGEAVVVVVEHLRLVLHMQQQHVGGFFAQLHPDVGVGLAFQHGIDKEVDKQLLLAGFRFFVLHINLACDGFVAVGDRGCAF